MISDFFVADGVTNAFKLSAVPVSNLNVYVDGLHSIPFKLDEDVISFYEILSDGIDIMATYEAV
jgi:hypothetical protein